MISIWKINMNSWTWAWYEIDKPKFSAVIVEWCERNGCNCTWNIRSLYTSMAYKNSSKRQSCLNHCNRHLVALFFLVLNYRNHNLRMIAPRNLLLEVLSSGKFIHRLFFPRWKSFQKIPITDNFLQKTHLPKRWFYPRKSSTPWKASIVQVWSRW